MQKYKCPWNSLQLQDDWNQRALQRFCPYYESTRHALPDPSLYLSHATKIHPFRSPDLTGFENYVHQSTVYNSSTTFFAGDRRPPLSGYDIDVENCFFRNGGFALQRAPQANTGGILSSDASLLTGRFPIGSRPRSGPLSDTFWQENQRIAPRASTTLPPIPEKKKAPPARQRQSLFHQQTRII